MFPEFSEALRGAYKIPKSSPNTLRLGAFLVFFLLWAVPLTGSVAFGQAGTPDPSFPASVGEFGGTVTMIRALPDGKALVFGDFKQFNVRLTAGIARLNPNGTTDVTFNIADPPDGSIRAVAVQPDGKYILAGGFNFYQGQQRSGLLRINNDGSIDPTFNANLPVDTFCFEIALQADGKILYNTSAGIFRVLPNGDNDTTFTSVVATANQIVPLTNGQFLVAGSYPSGNTFTSELRRYFANGQRDTTFNVVFNGAVTSVSARLSGFLFCGGQFTSVNGVFLNRVAKLTSNGQVDTTYQPDIPFFFTQSVFDLAVLADGSLYAIGNNLRSSILGGGVIRLTPTGSAYQAPNGIPQPDGDNTFYEALALQADDRLLLGGNFVSVSGTFRPAIARLNSTGGLDNSYVPVSGAQRTSFVTAMAVQPDARIVVGGSFSTSNGQPSYRLTRYTLDGVNDPTFTRGDGFEFVFEGPNKPSPFIYQMDVQSNGKILVAGQFNFFNGTPVANFVRLDQNGNLDTTFTATFAQGVVFAVKVLPDDKILVCGDFNFANGVARNGVARLNADGTLDTTFIPDASVNGSGVGKIALQQDGSVLLAGFSLIRLKPDGSRDNTFVVNPSGFIYDVFVQPDYRILISGTFSQINFTPISRVARINLDGTVDTSFVPGTAVSSQIEVPWGVTAQKDGKVIVAGDPTTKGTGIVRLNPDGSPDTTFQVGAGLRLISREQFFTPSVRAINLLPNNGLLVGGYFDLCNGKTARSLCRLNLEPIFDFSLSPTSAFFTQTGGTGSLTVTTAANSAWTPIGVPSWITGFPASATGTQTINFTVAPNPGSNRRAFISIGGQSFIVAQGDASCSFTLSTASLSTPFQGGAGSLTITASSPNCEWTALDLPKWVIGFPVVGKGTQTVNFNVLSNPGRARSATININGQTFTINQAANPCPFDIGILKFDVTGKASFKTINVTTNSGCPWTISSSVTWIGVVGSSVRNGTGSVTIGISPNPRLGPQETRTGAVFVAGQLILITQKPGRLRTTIGVQRPSDSKFYLRYSPTTGFADKEFIYGTGNDIALSGDWDGDGTDSVGVYRNGTFYLKNTNSEGNADLAFPYGQPGDIAVTGDWDGDGVDTVGVFRNGVFFLRNSNTEGSADLQIFYGQTGDKPVVGDWNGDGVDTIGIFRAGVFFLRNSNTTGFADIQVSFGIATDLPIVGDWDGDGTDTIGVYRNGEYYMRNFNSTGPFNILAYYGTAADVPIKGDWIHQ